MGHHPQIALTHRDEDRRDGDGVRGKMLELHSIVEAEGPHKATRGSTQAMAVELGE